MRVVVLGASGMLGHAAVRVLGAEPSVEVVATARHPEAARDLPGMPPDVEWRALDAEGPEGAVADVCAGADWAVNGIGVIKPHIHDDASREVERAIRINSLFPHALAAAGGRVGCRVLQIATDCVYSGSRGRYGESDSHDALDVYGKTKSLGEVHGEGVHHLRCSIIGPELKAHVSLQDWLLRQPEGATVNGFTNHRWNGVTIYCLARLCLGIITHGIPLPHLRHIVPADSVSKCQLLELLRDAHGRRDLRIVPVEAATVVDRTLATEDPSGNEVLWRAAGYRGPATVAEMVEESAALVVA